MTSRDIEISLAWYFDYRQNIIIPNVSWGLFHNMEVDLLMIRPSNYATEIEIKISASDIKADLKKGHDHKSKLIRQTYFAVPMNLVDNPNIPMHFGVLGIDENSPIRYSVKLIRAAKVNKDSRKLTNDELLKLGRLASMRIWSLKEKLNTEKQYRLDLHKRFGIIKK